MTRNNHQSLTMSRNAVLRGKIINFCGESFLFCVTAISLAAVIFIFFYIAKDALPFFTDRGFKEFLTSTSWYPANEPPQYGALANFYGTLMVTAGAIIFAVPLGISAAVCLSDVLPFKIRQIVKPTIELLAAIPSVAYGFFALVILAPLMQNHGGTMLKYGTWTVCVPGLFLVIYLCHNFMKVKVPARPVVQKLFTAITGITLIMLIKLVADKVGAIEVTSGTNALNVSFILGIMALPTIVSVAEDSLQACGRDLRAGSYALGATRAETLIKTVIPASAGGIMAAILLGIMRAIGETMVVWMASGNTARIPEPWYNVLSPVRTLTASIAGDMGEAARNTNRYHVLFAMALALLAITFVMNLLSQIVVNRQRKKLGK